MTGIDLMDGRAIRLALDRIADALEDLVALADERARTAAAAALNVPAGPSDRADRSETTA